MAGSEARQYSPSGGHTYHLAGSPPYPQHLYRRSDSTSTTSPLSPTASQDRRESFQHLQNSGLYNSPASSSYTSPNQQQQQQYLNQRRLNPTYPSGQQQQQQRQQNNDEGESEELVASTEHTVTPLEGFPHSHGNRHVAYGSEDDSARTTTPQISLTGVSPGYSATKMHQAGSSSSSSSTTLPREGGGQGLSSLHDEGRTSRSLSFGAETTPPSSMLLSNVSPRSPTSAGPFGMDQMGTRTTQQQPYGSNGGFFSSFRPSSAAGREQSDSSAARDTQDRQQVDASRRRDRVINASEQRSRRPSSVLEQVGGMLDRFGRKLGHSRGESRETNVSKRPMSSVNGSALDVDGVEEMLHEHSPNGSTMSQQFSPSLSISPSPAPWERNNVDNQQQQQSPHNTQGNNVVTGAATLRSPLVENLEQQQQQQSQTIPLRMQREFSAGSASSVQGLSAATEASSTMSNLGPPRTMTPVTASASSLGSTSTARASKRHSVLDRTLIQVTEDNERFSVVDISALDSSAAIKERMLSKLHLFDEDASSFSLYRTEIGMASASGPKIDDDELLALCWQIGDDRGTLKFLLQQTAPPLQASRMMPPPPVAASPRKAMRDLMTSDGLSAPLHAKSGSLSSRSSVSEVLGHLNDAQTGGGMGSGGANESGSETSSSRHQLHRSKATTRRGGQGSVISSGGEDIRSPTMSTRSTPSNLGLGTFSEQVYGSSSSTVGVAGHPEASLNVRDNLRTNESTVEEIRDAEEDESTLTASRPFGKLRKPQSQGDRNLSQAQQQSSATATSTIPASPRHQARVFAGETSSTAEASHGGQNWRGEHQERPMAHRATSQPHVGESSESANVPKSLQAGGCEPRGLDYADAAHMYLGATLSSPHDDLEGYPTLSPVSFAEPNPIHGTKSMEDIRLNKQRRHPSFSSAAEMPANAKQQILKEQINPLDFRDGRYPRSDVAMAPSSSSGNSNASTSHHHPSHRQTPPAPLQRLPQGQLPPSQAFKPASAGAYPGDVPNTFDRSRSASAGNMIPFKTGRAPALHSADPRLGHAWPPLMPSHSTARPMQQQQQHPQHITQHAPINHHASDPRFGGPPLQILRPVTSASEFGARSPHDPRSFSVRPHSFNEHHRPRPGFLPSPSSQPAALRPMHREDPFTSMHFPNSSSREVSNFQRHAVVSHGSLQPGMTVQETMHRPTASQLSPHAMQQPPTGPRDYRSPMPSMRSYEYSGDASMIVSPHGPPTPHSANVYGVMVSPRPPSRQPQAHHHIPQVHPQHAQHQQHSQHSQHPQHQHQQQLQRLQQPNAPSTQHALPQHQHQRAQHLPQHSQLPLEYYHDSHQLQQRAAIDAPHAPHQSRHAPSHLDEEERQRSSRSHHQQPQALLQQPVRPQKDRIRRPHTAAADGAGPDIHTQRAAQGSERSSGSSFTSSASHASHRRNISSDEGVQKSKDTNDDSFSAPTSARSSRSGPLSPSPEAKEEGVPSTQVPYDDTDAKLSRKSSLNDLDLLQMRPLPTPPGNPSPGAQEDFELVEELRDASSQDSETLKVGDWRNVMSSLNGRAGESQNLFESDLHEGSDSGTLRAGAASSSETSSTFAMGGKRSPIPDTSVSPTTLPPTTVRTALSDEGPKMPEPVASDEPNDVLAAWDNLEEDEEEVEGGTWMKPMAPKEEDESGVSGPATIVSRDGAVEKAEPRNENGSLLTAPPPVAFAHKTLRPEEARAIQKLPASPAQAASPLRPILTIQINGPNAPASARQSPSQVHHNQISRQNTPASASASVSASASASASASGTAPPAPSPRKSPKGPQSPRTTFARADAAHVEPSSSLSMTPTTEGATPMLVADRRPSASSTVTNASSSSSGSNLHRSTSFARRDDNDWASRPPPELLYENLDDFFPKLDLDKPVLEAANAPGSPLIGSEQAPALSPATANTPPLAGLSLTPLRPMSPAVSAVQSPRTGVAGGSVSGMPGRHKKSIRIVAQDRKKYMDRAEASERRRNDIQTQGEGKEVDNRLARRRSTKLWGGRVVEVTPGVDPSSATSLESPSSESSGGRPVFKWVKGDLIGRGTYGRVYLALNATTGEMIAVKQVELPTTASDREDIRQKNVVAALKSEIETLKDLDHPNIVSYLGYEETRQTLSIFLEYVPGGSVGSCLRKHGKLEEATIKSFLNQILEGLSYLHGRNILHRDLKADNLLVDHLGTVKISDFGTVRKSEDIYGNVASMSVQGSIFWMAPEVMSLSSRGYSAKVDIWSLGCVVLEMFAGRRPWSEEEAVHAMFKIGAERKAPPIPPDVRLSKAATHFLKTCFYVDPTKRPTASRLLEHVFPHPLEGWHFEQSSLYRHLSK